MWIPYLWDLSSCEREDKYRIYPHVRERMQTPETLYTTSLFRALKILSMNKKSFKIENNEKYRTYLTI